MKGSPEINPYWDTINRVDSIYKKNNPKKGNQLFLYQVYIYCNHVNRFYSHDHEFPLGI